MKTNNFTINMKYLSLIIVAVLFTIVSCSPNEEANLNGEFENSMQLEKKGMTVPGIPELFISGLQGASGSTIGPGGDLFVTEGAIGQITRIDLKTGEKTTFASGLPPSIIGIGGVNDVVFYGNTAYALVTLVGPQFGTSDTVGIYRIDGPDSFTVIADIGTFSITNPPSTSYFVDMGVHYSFDKYKGGFLVADAHHNRVLEVTREGDIQEFKVFGNIVPTGLAIRGNTVYMAEAGPVPHLPETGKIVSFNSKTDAITEIASGAPLLVDVEFNRGRTLFALAQGVWEGAFGGEGTPANPNTGSLVRVNEDGSFSVVASELNLPTSLEFVKNTAYIVNFVGEVWKIENVASPPFGAFN